MNNILYTLIPPVPTDLHSVLLADEALRGGIMALAEACTLNWDCYKVSTATRREGDCARSGGSNLICGCLMLRNLISLSMWFDSRMQSSAASSPIRDTPSVFLNGVSTANVIRSYRSSSRIRPHFQNSATYRIGAPGRFLIFSLHLHPRGWLCLKIGRHARVSTIIAHWVTPRRLRGSWSNGILQGRSRGNP